MISVVVGPLRLKEMMSEDSGLLWSPWFRIITERFLVNWWKDLRETLDTPRYVDVESIHRFECSTEYLGGAGNSAGRCSDRSQRAARQLQKELTWTNQKGEMEPNSLF